VPKAEALPESKPAAVLDTSAVMAHLNEEKGAIPVRKAIEEGAAISVANWAEVLSKSAMAGNDPGKLAEDLRDAVILEPITEADCIEIAKLRPKTKTQGLSLADRACLALAARLGVPALTADSIWTQTETSAEVKLIR
jgi:PIN domain nuclease of toxin-antitoxin system